MKFSFLGSKKNKDENKSDNKLNFDTMSNLSLKDRDKFHKIYSKLFYIIEKNSLEKEREFISEIEKSGIYSLSDICAALLNYITEGENEDNEDVVEDIANIRKKLASSRRGRRNNPKDSRNSSKNNDVKRSTGSGRGYEKSEIKKSAKDIEKKSGKEKVSNIKQKNKGDDKAREKNKSKVSKITTTGRTSKNTKDKKVKSGNTSGKSKSVKSNTNKSVAKKTLNKATTRSDKNSENKKGSTRSANKNQSISSYRGGAVASYDRMNIVTKKNIER